MCMPFCTSFELSVFVLLFFCCLSQFHLSNSGKITIRKLTSNSMPDVSFNLETANTQESQPETFKNLLRYTLQSLPHIFLPRCCLTQ